MELVDVCCNEAIRVELTAKGNCARRWLAGFPAYIGAPHDEAEGVTRFWDPPEFATPRDPTLSITLTTRGDIAEAVARCKHREVVVSNTRPVAVPKLDGTPLARRATAEETLEFACRWFLKWDHAGCVGLLGSIFFASQAAVAALAVDDDAIRQLEDHPAVADRVCWPAMITLILEGGFKSAFRRVTRLQRLVGTELGFAGLYFPDDPTDRPDLLLGVVSELGGENSPGLYA